MFRDPPFAFALIDDRGNRKKAFAGTLPDDLLPAGRKYSMWDVFYVFIWVTLLYLADRLSSGLGFWIGFGVQAAVVGVGLFFVMTVSRFGQTIRQELTHAIGRRTGREKMIIGVRLRRTECPCCAFELNDTEAEADGCTVCPECGSAWKLTAAPQSHPA